MSLTARSWRDFPAELKRARIANAMTQTELAQRLNVDQASVSRWENGRQAPDKATQSRLRDLLFRGRSMADARLLHFVNASASVTTLINMQGRYLAASQSFRKIWNPEQTVQHYMTPTLRNAWDMAMSVGLFRGEIASMQVPTDALTPDRQIIHAMRTWHLMSTSDGEPLLLGEGSIVSAKDYAAAASKGIVITPLDVLF